MDGCEQHHRRGSDLDIDAKPAPPNVRISVLGFALFRVIKTRRSGSDSGRETLPPEDAVAEKSKELRNTETPRVGPAASCCMPNTNITFIEQATQAFGAVHVKILGDKSHIFLYYLMVDWSRLQHQGTGSRLIQFRNSQIRCG